MKFLPLDLSLNTPVPPTVADRTEAASIIGEIAERLIELAECSGEAFAQRWIMRLATLYGNPECPRSGWVYVRLCTGDMSELVASHADHGAILHRSKQGEHKEHVQALRVIKLHFPELAQAITELENRQAKRMQSNDSDEPRRKPERL